MRVLFAGVPAIGHLFPLVPLAAALQARGNEVLFGSLDGGEVVTSSGLPFVNALPGLDWRTELRRRASAERPDLLARTVETNSGDREVFVRLAALVNDSVVESFVDLALRWRPDVVVYDYLFPAGLLAAARLGVSALQCDLGFIRTGRLRDLMLADLAPALDRLGIDVPAPVGVLDVAPPSMALAQKDGWPMQPIAFNGVSTLPAWLATRADRPRVAVTLGTVPPKVDGLTRVDRLIAAAAQVEAEFVLVMGKIDISTLGELPANVRAVGWVPWDGVVAGSDATIHHGGGGTALTTLVHGVPQLVLPDGSDRYANADAVHARGAGLRATAEDLSPALLGRLLTDEKLRLASREVAAEIAAMPTPADIAARVEALA
ncbi:glycosyltransferase [Amycolatopsis sp. NPDC059657]|uniref:glycosyltransferase n=1 Tax=Amycolatopsis sp. NPDC059657 TaxID=3346899 RepID=UPI003672BE6C